MCMQCVQEFRSPDQLWNQAQDADGSHNSWYKKAVSYWDQQEPSYNGVLGGFGYVSDIDVRDSRQLLEKVGVSHGGTRQAVVAVQGGGPVQRPQGWHGVASFAETPHVTRNDGCWST